MNIRTSRLTIISTILLVTQKTISSKKIPVTDMSPISNRFADLLQSLVEVNVERVDALKKLFKLYDVGGAKVLRTAQDGNDVSKLEETIPFFDNQDEYPEMINEPIGLDRDQKSVCFCRNNNDNDQTSQRDELKRAEKRESLGRNTNIHLMNDESSAEPEQSFMLSISSKQQSTEINSSVKEIPPRPLKSGKRPKSKYAICISPRRGYLECKSSCKEAYGMACAKYGCEERLYKQLRKECRRSCKTKFEEPYEDYD